MTNKIITSIIILAAAFVVSYIVYLVQIYQIIIEPNRSGAQDRSIFRVITSEPHQTYFEWLKEKFR